MQLAAVVVETPAKAPAEVRRVAQALVADGRAVVVGPGTFGALAEALGGRVEAGRWLTALVAELGEPIVLIVAIDGGARSLVVCVGPPAWDTHDTAAYLESLSGELALVLEPFTDAVARAN